MLREIEVTHATIATWEWEGKGAPLLLVPTTGLHGRCWDRVVEALPDRRVIAVDVRGHGEAAARPRPTIDRISHKTSSKSSSNSRWNGSRASAIRWGGTL